MCSVCRYINSSESIKVCYKEYDLQWTYHSKIFINKSILTVFYFCVKLPCEITRLDTYIRNLVVVLIIILSLVPTWRQRESEYSLPTLIPDCVWESCHIDGVPFHRLTKGTSKGGEDEERPVPERWTVGSVGEWSGGWVLVADVETWTDLDSPL